jgi:hypothetical protein
MNDRDWLSPWMSWQREAIHAQQATLEAMRRAVDPGEGGVALKEASRTAAEANLRALEHWAKIWGVGR